MSTEEKSPGYIDILIECNFCGGLVPDDFECIKCGAELLEDDPEAELIYVCSVCRADVNEDAAYCSGCGTIF